MNNALKKLALAVTLLSPLVAEARPELYQETAYTLSNTTANSVLAFRLNADGSMQPAGSYPTGGTGSGAGLGNQGALALSENRHYLFAINAGSNDVSVFRVRDNGLELVHRAAEPGLTPVSLTVAHDRVYVVNAGDDSIFGYRFNARSGRLYPLEQSYRKLGDDASGPAQISFDRDGDALVVTEKAGNKIVSFTLDNSGLPDEKHSLASAGNTPFGFAFGKRNRFFVSEAQGGAANGATVSAYRLHEDGSVQLLDGAVAVEQTAACWLTTTPNGKFAFTANTPASSISAFVIGRNGQLELLQARAADESRPNDLAVSDDGQHLYTLSNGDHSMGVYRIGAEGDLQAVSRLTTLPAGVTGLVLR
ncbi:lactonase family protein [Methylomonas sp. TEB]|uniref:lactonase family protein n=1 Tax=Methylomonas sp. TEB TaxID=3398229 RepID=UPI0039F4E618